MAAKYDTDFYAWTQETAQAIREKTHFQSHARGLRNKSWKDLIID
jgi:hypothetical protein